jgi:Zn-dependent protease with chaperone function
MLCSCVWPLVDTYARLEVVPAIFANTRSSRSKVPPQKMAYCLGGLPGTVVVTSAAVAALDRHHPDAVLAHERAHLAGRHHLLLGITRALAASLPRLRLFTVAHKEVARLLERR